VTLTKKLFYDVSFSTAAKESYKFSRETSPFERYYKKAIGAQTAGQPDKVIFRYSQEKTQPTQVQKNMKNLIHYSIVVVAWSWH